MSDYPLDNAVYQWEEGHRRFQQLGASDPRLQRQMLRAVEAIRTELRRRIGPTFSAVQLADLYGRGTDWCLQIGDSMAPEQAHGWDPQTIADTAFYLYLRGATDWAGGRSAIT